MTAKARFIALSFPILAILATSGCRQSPGRASATAPVPEVTVTAAIQKDVPISGEWVATLDGFVNAQIQPHVSGYLIRQNYREGASVRKDEVLFEIDPRPFQAALDQARGQLAQAKGQLAQAEGQLAQTTAQWELAQINVKRDTPLAEVRAIAQSQLDSELQVQKTAEANIATSKASIQMARAAIQSAEAAVRNGELNLEFTKVRSLVDGVAGMAAVQIGNLVSPTTVLTTVSQVNPIKVYFPITEQEYLKVTGLSKSQRGDGWLKRSSVPLQLILSDGSSYPHTGRVIFTDRQVDSQTGTIRVVGSFPNPGNVLRPGQFGRVTAVKEMARGALLVPQRAVSEVQGQRQVAVVANDNRVLLRPVIAGVRVGTFWVIENGLAPGERVITEGTAKVAEGSLVSPKMDARAQSEEAPKAN